MTDIAVRAPLPSDASAISALLGELGYPADANDIPRRLEALALDASTAATWVAEIDGQVVGVASARSFPAIHQASPVAWLTALVVAEKARGKSVGQRLVQVAEDWARQRGATRLSLTSALHREEAHQFYEHLGYKRTGVRLAKIF